MQNPLIQMLLGQLKVKNPQGHQVIQNLMQSNGNPQALLQQMVGNMSSEQKESLLNQCKNYGVPNDILSKVQNMK